MKFFKKLFSKKLKGLKTPEKTGNLELKPNVKELANIERAQQELEIAMSLSNSQLLDDQQRVRLLNKTFQRTASQDLVYPPGVVMDSESSMPQMQDLKTEINNFSYLSNEFLLSWFVNSNSFIGYQNCGMLAQNWLIDKCCVIPARDAIRNGYRITVNNNVEIFPEIIDKIKQYDEKFKLNENLLEFVKFNRVFGIRIAMFKIDSDDEDFYLKPFNIDGVKPGSYKGIVQIDPQFITPELDLSATMDFDSLHFYEPTWWRTQNKKIHRSHLIIIRGSEMPDLLKPTYLYGGLSIPQKMYERVYCAERIANEAPKLAMSKRMTIYKMSAESAELNPAFLAKKLWTWITFQNNFGIKTIDKESEDIDQKDTNLADFDTLLMNQYQLVAAIANIPAAKLLGTTPKGFNATGDYEEKSYHEELESIQTHDLTPLIERHHQLIIKSYIMPKFNIKKFDTTVKWMPVGSLTAKEQADINLVKANTDQILSTIGAIQAHDSMQRLINDPSSEYNSLEIDTDLDDQLNDEDDENAEKNVNQEKENLG